MSVFRVEMHDPRPLQWWHAQYVAGKVDMEPPYQRRPGIWSAWKKGHLIDSILNGFDVPKFYLADFSTLPSRLNKAKRPYAIIDGKQRFEALFSFLKGELLLNQSSVVEDHPELKVGGLNFVELKANHPHLAARIEKFTPVVMSVVSDDGRKIDQMFIRLNSGEAANSAEKRNASPGPIPLFIRELVVHRFFNEKIRFNVKRMQDFNLAVKLFAIEHKGGFIDTKARNLDQFVNEAAEARSNTVIKAYTNTEDRVIGGLELMCKVFGDSDPLLAAQGHIPVYYWVIRQHPQVAKSFRSFLEKFNSDVRTNLQRTREDRNFDSDKELLAFYTMGRTTNDQGSLRGRYLILARRLGVAPKK